MNKIIIDFYYKYSKKHKNQIKQLFEDSFNIPNNDIVKNTMIIAYIYDNYIVAMNCLMTNQSLNKANDGMFMYNLCVHKSFRNKGIGKLLTNNAIQFTKSLNKKTLSLQVYNDNINAINIYTKLDMKPINSGIDPDTKKPLTTYFRWCD